MGTPTAIVAEDETVLREELRQHLQDLWPQYSDEECPFMPVLQDEVGNPDSYLRHAGMYGEAGVRLRDYPVVGVGSVCRIQATSYR